MEIGESTLARDALAWLALARVRGLSPAHARTLAAAMGGPRAVMQASRATLEMAGCPAEAAAGIVAAGRWAAAEARAIARAGAHLLTWDSPDYPERLRQIPDAPLALAVLGVLKPAEPAVAMVGARRATPYGIRMAEELAAGLARAGVAVVSGLATGIDAAAHRAALAAGGRTIAVLGTGIDRVYPAWHGPLAAEVARGGALVSEFRCGAPALPHHFPQRNRIISALGLGTVVVEAAERSGSLITARLALEQGREVFAVPGPVGPAQHRAPHRLIQQGAKLVTRVEDVLEEIAPALLARLAAAQAAMAEVGLDAIERHVLAAIGDGAAHVDQVVGAAGVPAGRVLETLLALELRGVVEQVPGTRFRRRAA